MIYDSPIRTSAQNLDRVLAAGLPILLSFEAPRCEPCAAIDAPLRELAREYAGRALIVRVEDSTQGTLPEKFKITRVPTLVAWRNGGEVARSEGALAKDALRQYMEYLAGSGAIPAPATGPSMSISGRPTGNDGARQAEWSSSNVSSAPNPAGNGAPIVVSDASFERDVLKSVLPVLVDFWAPWCGPCRMVSPIVEELGREYHGRLTVAKMNTDENPLRPSGLGIRGIPTLILFKGGREVDRIVGAAPKPMLKQFVERNLN